MFQTASPYIQKLFKGKINWKPYTYRTLNLAIKEDKIVFIHIGNIANIAHREAAMELFSDKEVVDTINKNFIPVAIDSEDVPEAYLIGLDLLLINEHKVSCYINVFSLPGLKPFISFSSLDKEQFISITNNIIESFKNKRELLNKASHYLVERLLSSGVVTKKEPPINISEKILHLYVESWIKRFNINGTYYKRSPYTLNARYYIFLLKYAVKYNKTDIVEFIKDRLKYTYYSAIFCPIDNCSFKQSYDYTFKEPLYEVDISENAQIAILYSMAYKYTGENLFKEVSNNILEYIQKNMHSSNGGYITSKTLKIKPSESTYYKFSLKELKDNFNTNYLNIASYLGMDTNLSENKQQIIFTTPNKNKLTNRDIEILKKIRSHKSKELLCDNRVIIGHNSIFATALCIIARNSAQKEKEYYISKAEQIIKYLIKIKTGHNNIISRYISSDNEQYYESDLYDYSLLLNCTLSLYSLTKKEIYKELTNSYSAFILLNFYQSYNGMFSKSYQEKNEIPFKRESIIDYTRFSANSVMAGNLLFLYKLTKDNIYLQTFKQMIYNIEPHLIGSGPLMTGWALQILNYLTHPIHYSLNNNELSP